MRISNKVVLIAVFAVALYTLLDLITQRLVIQPSFEELEEVDA